MTQVVAAYAALVATLSFFVGLGGLVWSIHVGRRDNPRLRLTIDREIDDGRLTAVVFKIINAGRRPVTVTRCGFFPKSDAALAGPSQAFPETLAEGGIKRVRFRVEPLLGRWRSPDAEQPRRAYVLDAAGRTHAFPVSGPLRRQIAEALRARKPPSARKSS